VVGVERWDAVCWFGSRARTGIGGLDMVGWSKLFWYVRQVGMAGDKVGLDIGAGRRFAKVRRGRDACGMFRQSRNGPDILEGLGNERLGQAVADGFV
jgi:hypothetical protein